MLHEYIVSHTDANALAKVRAVSVISECAWLAAWMSWNFSQASETLEMNSLTKTSLSVYRGLATMSQSFTVSV